MLHWSHAKFINMVTDERLPLREHAIPNSPSLVMNISFSSNALLPLHYVPEVISAKKWLRTDRLRRRGVRV
jgi:hypothetical protein